MSQFLYGGASFIFAILDLYVILGIVVYYDTEMTYSSGNPTVLANVLLCIYVLCITKGLFDASTNPVNTNVLKYFTVSLFCMPLPVEISLVSTYSYFSRCFDGDPKLLNSTHLDLSDLKCYNLTSPLYITVLVFSHLCFPFFIWWIISCIASCLPTFTNSAQDPSELTSLRVDYESYMTFKNINDINKRQKDVACSICAEDYTDSDDIRLLKNCSHYFHRECVEAYFKKNNICPICRTREF